MWSIALDALWGLTTEIRWIATRWAAKVLTNKLGVIVLLSSYDAVTYIFICNTSRTSVSVWKVTTDTWYLFINVCVALSVLVIWEIFTNRNFWSIRWTWISLAGKLLKTRRGWMVSGSGYYTYVSSNGVLKDTVHRGGPSSIIGQSMSHLWVTSCHWAKLSPSPSGFFLQYYQTDAAYSFIQHRRYM